MFLLVFKISETGYSLTGFTGSIGSISFIG